MEDVESRHLRVLRVLEQLTNTMYPQTLAQLAQRTGVPKTSLTRMLREMERMSYVTRLPGDVGYVPGPRAHKLALSTIQTPHLLRACRHILGKLVAITDESCNLTALAGDTVQYLARVESPGDQRLQLHMAIGAKVPLHCTASGKLFLAFTGEPQQQKILDRLTLSALTPSTITDRTKLEAELRRTRAQRLGIDDQEFVRGMVAIAVPVMDARSAVIAAVACHAATAQKSLRELLEFTEPMWAASEAISALFAAETER